MSVTDQALSVVRDLGWAVFPVGASKRPCISRAEGGHGFHDATLDPAEVERLFAHRGAALVGTPTGLADGFDVLDIDYRNGGGAWEAENEWRLPETRIHRTMNGGRHYLFRHVDGVRNSASKDSLAPGVDVRGTGGYIVTQNSKGYSIDSDADIAEWPDWLLDMVLARPVSDERPPRDPNKPVVPLSSKRLDGLMRAILGRVSTAADGSKHYKLRNASRSVGGLLVQGGMSEADATERLMHALPPSVKDWNLARKTIAWGLEQGALRPLELEDRPYNGNGYAEPLGMFKLANGLDKGESVVKDTDPPLDQAQQDFPASPLDWDEMLAIEPREWVYGHFLIKRFISVLGAPGGTGKTAYSFAVALAIATGSNFLGEDVHSPGNVWIYNLEDPKAELLRRVHAVIRHYGFSRFNIEGRLFVDSGRDRALCIAEQTRDGGIVVAPIFDAVIAEIQRHDIRLMIVDPFVRSHKLSENDNDQIDAAAALWAAIADKANCSILLVHHFRKGGISGDAAAFRGASALIDAARAAISLATMSEEEANRLGVNPTERQRYIRADNAKLNLAPPPETTVWLKLIGVDLDNATPSRPSDKVQTVERWEPVSTWAGMPWSSVIQILETIDAGLGNGEFYAKAPQAKDRWAGRVIIDQTGKGEKAAKDILKSWLEAGVLIEGQYPSPKQNNALAGCIRADPDKLREMQSEAAARDVADD